MARLCTGSTRSRRPGSCWNERYIDSYADAMSSLDAARSAGGVVVDVTAGVAVITIDRPEVRNAIGFTTIGELDDALTEVAESAAVVVIRGAGDRAFVSGGDLKEFGAVRTHEDAVAMASRVRRV